MKKYRIKIEGRVFDVKVLDDPRQAQVQVEVDGEVFTVDVEAVTQQTEPTPGEDKSVRAAVPPPPDATAMSRTLTAPLPGVIKSIAVRPDQQVSVKDELLIIEAMKMDNVIRAPREARIGTVHVSEGHRVAYGDPLLELVGEG